MTPKQKFIQAMKSRGVLVADDFYGGADLIPHHYKSKQGDHYLISGIRLCIFTGSNTPKGGLGCIVFYYTGVKRQYRHKQSYQSEILKKAECYKTAKQAIGAYDKWLKTSQKTINNWKVVI